MTHSQVYKMRLTISEGGETTEERERLNNERKWCRCKDRSV